MANNTQSLSNNKTVTAVLLDTVSIQKYIFSGRKLREFVGASYLVEWIYDEPILKVLQKMYPSTSIDLTAWKNNSGTIQILNGADFEVGYIGGGNALLFFSDTKKAKEFIKEWTSLLLHKAPGLIPAAALIDDFDFNDNNYVNSIKKLFEKLEEIKVSYPVNVFIPGHGLTAECQFSGGNKEIYQDEEYGFISSILKTKLNFTAEANNRFKSLLPPNLPYDFDFPLEIDKLGQKKGQENYIAIVHIDGNATGQLFRNCKDLGKTRKLSVFLKEKTAEAMKTTIDNLIAKIPDFQEFLDLSKTNGSFYLPIRPIILGGDDVTFICHGKLGIWLTEKFIENYHDLTKNNAFNSNFSLSAGVLITKSHMPFYRAYRLSEELCAEAKKRRKELNDTGSWIDFHIAYGGFTGTINEIREKHYRTHKGPLYLRPYKIDNNSTGIYSFSALKDGAKKLTATLTATLPRSLPRSKVLDLRKILALGDDNAAKAFLNNLRIRGLTLPDYPGGKFQNNIWDTTTSGNICTPYFDMIELAEFYPF
jgi:hypothetical protein